jgi:hypothetical protein
MVCMRYLDLDHWSFSVFILCFRSMKEISNHVATANNINLYQIRGFHDGENSNSGFLGFNMLYYR